MFFFCEFRYSSEEDDTYTIEVPENNEEFDPAAYNRYYYI